MRRASALSTKYRLAKFGDLKPVQIPASWFFAITISACAGQLLLPLHAQTEKGPQALVSQSDDTNSEPTEPEPLRKLPQCMAQWYSDSKTKQEWLRACERAEAEEASYNADYARCLADWDPETHMTKREWHRSCTDVVHEQPSAFEAAPGER
jgi:hypothetical protein